MARRGSVTDMLYKMARASNTARAASRGPVSLGKREIRRRAYRVTGRMTRRALRRFGL